MFNRVLQVKMVKKDKTETPTSVQSDEFEGKAAIIGQHLKDIVEYIGVAVVCYVALDTIRQVAVANAKK